MATEINVKTDEKPVKPVKLSKNKDRFPWQRLSLSLLGIVILVGMWRWATYHLYSLPDHSIAAFTSLTNNTVYAIAALVIFFVTGRLVYEWKNQTVASVVEQGQHLFEHKEEKLEQVITMRTEGGAKAFADDIE